MPTRETSCASIWATAERVWNPPSNMPGNGWGPGIAIKILYDELRPWVTPYDPANKIIFGAGTLHGNNGPRGLQEQHQHPRAGDRRMGKRLQRQLRGGQLKYAGYDSVIIEGRAHTPVYLWIRDDRVELRDAPRLWGKTTWETLDGNPEGTGRRTLHTVSIGPAGENLVRGACVIQDGEGLRPVRHGAVMGSKNLKAIVAKGTGAIRVAHPQTLHGDGRQDPKDVREAQERGAMRKYGTLRGLAGKQKICGVKLQEFQDASCRKRWCTPWIPARRSKDTRSPARASGMRHRVRPAPADHGGPYAGLETECGQMEVLTTCKPAGHREPTFMFKANALCNQMGLDVDAAGGPIGWAMECYQRGILDEKDTDGLKLNGGTRGSLSNSSGRSAGGKGSATSSPKAAARAADLVGRDSAYYAMHIKGQDLYEPLRGALGWCLGTTTSTRGGGHTTGRRSMDASGRSRKMKEKVQAIFGVDNPSTLRNTRARGHGLTYMEVAAPDQQLPGRLPL